MSSKSFEGNGRGLPAAGRGLFLFVALAAACLAPSCGTDTDEGVRTDLPLLLSGTSQTVPQVAGDWSVTTGITANHCGTKVIPIQDRYILRITQAGSALQVLVFDHCGTELATAAGTVDASKVVTFAFRQRADIIGCSLSLDQRWTGTVQADPQKMDGQWKLDVSGDAGCGAGLPCTVTGQFAAGWCARGECSFDACSQ